MRLDHWLPRPTATATEKHRTVTGRFWTPSGGLPPTTAATFAAGPPIGQAQVAWNFYLESLEAGATVLSTETRVRVAPGTARTQFLIYWSVVRPFSGLLRRLMLRAMRREVERVSRASA